MSANPGDGAAATLEPTADPTTAPTGNQPLPDGLANLPEDDATGPAPEPPKDPDPEPSPQNKKPGGPGWKAEPVRNFQRDKNGKVKFDANGDPKRKRGKPAKPRPGDQLMDGSTYGDQTGQARGGIHIPGSESSERVGNPQGPEMGRVIARIVPQTMKTLFGEEWDASEDERKFMADSFGEATDGRRFPAIIVMILALLIYFMPRLLKAWWRWIQQQQQQQAQPEHPEAKAQQAEASESEKRETQQNGSESHTNNRQDGVRKDTAGGPIGAARFIR
jgi:hypothetical protein